MQFEGPVDLVQGLRHELSPLVIESPLPRDPDMWLNLLSSRAPERTDSRKVDYISLKMNPLARLYPSYEIRLPEGLDPLKIDIVVNEHRYRYNPLDLKDALANMMWKVFDRSWMSRLDALTYSIVNAVIEPLSLLLVPKKAPLVHSAGIAYKSMGFLLSGSGGIGKTGIATSLLTDNRRVLFLNDDMATTDAAGRIHFYPRNVMIYRSNVEDNPYVDSSLKQLQSVSDRIHWHLHRSRDSRRMARRRVPAIRLFGSEKICWSPVTIGAAFFLRRGGEQSFSHSTPDDFARRMASIMVREEHVEISHFLFKTGLVKEGEWRDRYVKAVVSRLVRSQAAIINVSIPRGVDYGELSLRIMDEMEGLVGRRRESG